MTWLQLSLEAVITMIWKLGELFRLVTLTPLEIEQRGEKWFLSFTMSLMVLAEICLCALIITRVAYTEIDWVAYMQEVKGFLGGERNYLNLHGDTGPLVYPAGFLYLYSAMYWLSSDGEDVLTAQYLFLILYVSLVGLVLAIYRSAGGTSMPLWSLLLVCASRRVHSIFVLRMFNDGMAMWLLYAATYCFLLNRWRSGCVLYSLGVGVKMNILLFAPGLLLLLLQANGFAGTIICLTICAGVQLLLGAPFLLRHPVAYLMRSFELGRVFMYKWTVNLKFVDEETFVSPILARTLLALTVVTLGLFAAKWLRVPSLLLETGGNEGTSRREDGCEPVRTEGTKTGSKKLPRQLPPEYLVKTLFVSNFIGVVFCRSLHYQFYAWYYHTLPFLLWQTDLPIVARLIVLGAVEYSFNVFPATPTSSLVLQASHFVLLAALWVAPVSRDTKGSSTTRPKEA